MLAGSMLTLSACGGGGGSDPVYKPPSAPKLSGTAAVGAAIVDGTVTAKCADGNTFTQTVTTDANGNWSGTLASATMPCALQVTGGTPPDTLYSYTSSTGTVNITPLTTLALAQATNELPADWFAAFDGTPVDVATAAGEVLDALDTSGFDLPPSGNPFTTPFVADGTGWDGLLDDLKQAITNDPALADLEALVTLVKDGNLATAVPDAPPPPSYQVSGTIAGASGSLIWEIRVGGFIRNDGSNGNGPVTFTSPAGLEEGNNWSVVINSPPAGQTCNVANGTGTLTDDVTNVSITCSDIVVDPTGYSIEGTISGASGDVSWQTLVGGVFYHDGTDGNGNVTFTYGDGIADGSNWSVEVLTPPAGQTCNVANGSGTIAGNITNVAITCSDIVVTPTTFSIEGTLSGATGTVQWETRVNGEEFFSGSSINGAITFTPVEGMESGSNWSVVVAAPPAGQTCNVTNGSGTLSTDIANVSIACQDEGVDPDPGSTPIYDFSALNLQPSVPVDMVPTPPAATPVDPSSQIPTLFQQLGDAERAKIFAPAPANLTTTASTNYGNNNSYKVTERTADVSWYRETLVDPGPDDLLNTADDFIAEYTVAPNGSRGVAYSFNHPGPDNIWYTEDDASGRVALGRAVNFPYSDTLLEYEGASEGAILVLPCLDPGSDDMPFTADDQPGCTAGYQVVVLDGEDNRGQVVTYDAAGPDGLWFTADDRVKNYTLLTYNGTGVGVASVVYNGKGSDNLWFTEDDAVQLHTLTQLGDDYKPRYTATYNAYGGDSNWFTADDVVQSWTYYGYDAEGNNILVATHTNKRNDGLWFTADDTASAIISLKDENGHPMISAQITSGGMGPDGIWLSGDEVLQGYSLSKYNSAGLQTQMAQISGKGADNLWFTSDDELSPSNYWVREYDGEGRMLKWLYMDPSVAPSEPAFSDAHIYRYRVYNYTSASLQVDLQRTSGGFGADNMPFTEDDILTWPYSVATPTGLDQFNQPGPDGQWFTADDVRSGYVVYTYDGLRRTEQQFNTSDEVISYTEIVPINTARYRLNTYARNESDELVLTGYSIIDEDLNGYPLETVYYTLADEISYVQYTEHDADGNIIREGWSSTPGSYTSYTVQFFNNAGELLARGSEYIGSDGQWGTADDTFSIQSIYQLANELDVLALNTGVMGDTCGTLLSGLGASGDINLLVRDQSGAPLSGVIAQLGPNGATVTTDANGEAAFTGLNGTQDVHLFKDGYAWESFYCVAPGMDVTLHSRLASLSVTADSSKVSFYIQPTNTNVTLRLLDAQGNSVASRSHSTSSGGEAGTTYGDLHFDLPAGSEVSGELWVFEVDYSSGRLVSAQSLGQQTYTTIPWNTYPSSQDREQLTVSMPTGERTLVAFDGPLGIPHGAGYGTFGVSLNDLFVLPFSYESAFSDYVATVPDVTLPTNAEPTAVVASYDRWRARYPGNFPGIGNGTFNASIRSDFQYAITIAGQTDSSATPTINWMPATQKGVEAFLSATTIELHSAAGGAGWQSHWTIHTPPGENQVTLPSLPVGITGPALPQTSYGIVAKALAVPTLGYHALIGTQDLRDIDSSLAIEELTTGEPLNGKLHR